MAFHSNTISKQVTTYWSSSWSWRPNLPWCPCVTLRKNKLTHQRISGTIGSYFVIITRPKPVSLRASWWLAPLIGGIESSIHVFQRRVVWRIQGTWPKCLRAAWSFTILKACLLSLAIFSERWFINTLSLCALCYFAPLPCGGRAHACFSRVQTDGHP